MEHVTIHDVETSAFGSDIDRRGLSEPLGTEDFAINHYRLDPEERLSGGMHAHLDQEEVFVVVDGEATFETMDGEVTLQADEAIRFEPGEYQTGYNSGEEELVVLAMGAPRGSEDVRIPQECPECGHDNMRAIPGEEGFVLQCPDCEAEMAE